MLVKAGCLLGALMLSGMALGAEESLTAPGGLGASGTTMDVRVVNVEAEARDSSGRPVSGLTAADFRLTVDGKEVPIDYFTEVADGQEVASRAGAADGAPTAPVKVGTNYLIFVDDAFSLDVQRNRVLDRLKQDLKLGTEDRVAIVAYAGQPVTLTSWTNDMQRVERIFDRIKEHRVPRIEVQFPSVEMVTTAASMAMRGLPSRPGRKVFLLVSGGWPELVAHSEVAPEDVSSLLSEVPKEKLFEPVADTANLLGYTVYFLEIPHVFSAWGSHIDQRSAQTLPYGRFALVELGGNYGPYTNTWNLARRTGGTAVLYSPSRNTLEGVERDAHSYYSLAFSPDWKGDGLQHAIAVKVRKPGVKVQARDGYFDMSPRMETILKAESQLLFGEGTTVEAVAGKPRWGGLGAINLPVTLSVPARLVTARPVAGGYEVKVTVSAFSTDDWGYGMQQPDTPLVLTLPQAPGPDDVIPFTVTLNLSTLGQQVAFVVLDDAGRGVGRGEMDWNRRPRS
ncbi:MAG TPA: VWA domain-containing protein [Thermoanaerobaculia bacterium]|jgi:VWFA-related protein|nr:VWA domain-containing protein [Thermoanaerobaculia bacterium]